MRLRDHFRPPISKRSSWEGFHGLWPGIIVQQLESRLPDGFVAEARVHLGIRGPIPWPSVSRSLLSRSGYQKLSPWQSTWKRATRRRAACCEFHG